MQEASPIELQPLFLPDGGLQALFLDGVAVRNLDRSECGRSEVR